MNPNEVYLNSSGKLKVNLDCNTKIIYKITVRKRLPLRYDIRENGCS